MRYWKRVVQTAALSATIDYVHNVAKLATAMSKDTCVIGFRVRYCLPVGLELTVNGVSFLD